MAFASTLRKNISKLKSEFKWEDGSVHSEAKHLWGRIDFRHFSGFITHRAHSIVSIVQESRCLIRKRRNYIPAGWLEPVCLYYHHRRLIYSLDELFVELFFLLILVSVCEASLTYLSRRCDAIYLLIWNEEWVETFEMMARRLIKYWDSRDALID